MGKGLSYVVIAILALASLAILNCNASQNVANAQTTSTASNSTGPIAWWKLNEGVGTTVSDSSGNNFSGVIQGATWVTDQTGNSLYFNGNSSYVSLPSLDLTNADSLTVVAWIYSDVSKVGYIFYNGEGEVELGNGALTNGQAPAFNISFARFAVHLSDFVWYTAWSSTPLEPNTWHQLVGVWVKGASLKIYVDGVLSGEIDSIPADNLFNPGSGWTSSLGIYSQGDAGIPGYFKGQMSNILVYDRALTSVEIQTLDLQFSKPVAVFTCSPEVGSVGNSVMFNASSSQPSFGEAQPPTVTAYYWIFGDGNTLSTNQSTISHSYTTQNTYNVTLTVFDSNGDNSSTSQVVQVKMPTAVSISTSSTTLAGSPVNITGDLTDVNGNGLSSQIVVLYYTFAGINSWLPISSSATDPGGNYNIQWVNTATGIFTLMVQWQGNDTFFGTNNTVTLCSLPCQNQTVFFVESNSTISALTYNSTSYQLGFTATGGSGTSGYAQIAIARSLISNIDSTTVYLDDKQVPYATSCTSDTWLLKFSYTQSSDEFTVNLPVNSSFQQSSSPFSSSSVSPSPNPALAPSPTEQPSMRPTLKPSSTPIANFCPDWIPSTVLGVAAAFGLSALVYLGKRRK